jgi:hypothetical protein
MKRKQCIGLFIWKDIRKRIKENQTLKQVKRQILNEKEENAKNKRFLKRTREKIDSDMALLKEFEIQPAKDQSISFDRSTHTEIVVSYSNKK